MNGTPGARRADQEHALRDAAAHRREPAGLAQEVDDLLDLVLRFVDAGDVLKRDDLAAAVGEPGAAGRVDAAGGRAIDHEAEEGDEDTAERDRAAVEGARLGRRLRFDAHAVLHQIRGEGLRDQEGGRRHAARGRPVDQGDREGAVGEADLLHGAQVDLLQELGKGDLPGRRLAARQKEDAGDDRA
jgi:hypothetical protein